MFIVLGITAASVVSTSFAYTFNQNQGVAASVEGSATLLDEGGNPILAPTFSSAAFYGESGVVESMNVTFNWHVTGNDVDWNSMTIRIERSLHMFHESTQGSKKIGSEISTLQVGTFSEVVNLDNEVSSLLEIGVMDNYDEVRVEYRANVSVSANSVYGNPLSAEGRMAGYFELAWVPASIDLTVTTGTESGSGSASGAAGAGGAFNYAASSITGGNVFTVPFLFIGLGCFAVFIILNKKKHLLG